jgi:hypothetical protein
VASAPAERDAVVAEVRAELLAERFPTVLEVSREQRRRPLPLAQPSSAPAWARDDEVTRARRRQILNDAMTTASGHHRGAHAA